jgi:hypothetical protein
LPTGTPTAVGSVTQAATNATTVNLTTTGAVPAGAGTWLFEVLAWVAPVTRPTATVSGAGLSGWTQIALAQGTDTDPYDLQLWAADASAGVSSGAVIANAFTASKYGINAAAFYISGCAAASIVDGTPVSTFRATPTGTWSSGSYTPGQTDDTILAVALGDGLATGGSTPSGTIANEITGTDTTDTTNQWTIVADYLTGATTSAVNGQGTWASTPSQADAAMILGIKVGSAVVSASPRTFNAIPFIGGGL